MPAIKIKSLCKEWSNVWSRFIQTNITTILPSIPICAYTKPKTSRGDTKIVSLFINDDVNFYVTEMGVTESEKYSRRTICVAK